MVKFSKQLELQLVPEWRHKFCDYWHLKKELKKMKAKLEQSNSNSSSKDNHTVTNGGKWMMNFENATSSWTPLSTFTHRNNINHQAIKVHVNVVVMEANHNGGGVRYETEVLEPWSEDDLEKSFFSSLDKELNKVNDFFCTKEQEFVDRAYMLSRQLTSLTQITQSYHQQQQQRSQQNQPTNHVIPHTNNILDDSFCKRPAAILYSLVNSCFKKNTSALSSNENSINHHHQSPPSVESDESSRRPLCRRTNSQSLCDNDINGFEGSFFTESHVIDMLPAAEDNKDHDDNKRNNPNNILVNEDDRDGCEDIENSYDDVYDNDNTSSYNFMELLQAPTNAGLNMMGTTVTSSPGIPWDDQIKREVEGKKTTTLAGKTSIINGQHMNRSTIKILKRNLSLLNSTKDSKDRSDDNCVSMRKIKYAHKMLRIAFVEFYRGLGLLRTFSSLNALAFAKILKKHDKITKMQTFDTYMKVVEEAHFSTSDKVIKMMDEVEKIFTEHFAKDDEKKAMMLLRPEQNEAPHTITFFLGLFTGSSFALLVAFSLLLHLYTSHFSREIVESYTQTTYEVFGMIFLVLLHMYLYGWNVYAWKKSRINYAFIFEFAPKTELRHREVFLVCTGLTTIILSGMIGHLMVYYLKRSQINPDLVPLLIIMGLMFLLICPFDILYRPSRVYFLRCMKRLVLAPFYKVLMADFFLADQLTSQVVALRSLQFMMCYFLGGFFRYHDLSTCEGKEFRFFAYLISFLPYWWRLMQCLRRWLDEGDRSHLTNGGKYLSAMVAVGARISYSYYTTSLWLVVFLITSSFATLYQMYWDIVRDWGFFQANSKNVFLRDQLLLKNKSIYYFSIILNFILRFAWLQQVTRWQIKDINHNGTDLFFATLEVIRRGHWNFYRLENEHLNNVGKYRAVKLVPLPFQDTNPNHT